MRNRHAVAVFTRDLHITRNAGNRFKPVFRGKTRVETRAAAQNQNPVHFPEHRLRVSAENRRRDAGHPLQGVSDRARLLENFLLHIVTVRSKRDVVIVSRNDLHLTVNRNRATILRRAENPGRVRRNFSNIAFLKENKPFRHARERKHVRGEEVLLIPEPHDERRAAAGTYHHVRLLRAADSQTETAAETRHSLRHGVEQIAFKVTVDEMRDHLGIRLTRELISLRHELRLQFGIVFNNAVMDERDRVVRNHRMGVPDLRRSMRCPPGVGNTDTA